MQLTAASILLFLIALPTCRSEKVLVNFAIDEESQVGSTVGNVATAAKLDRTYTASQFRKLQFALLDGDSSFFTLHRHTGRLQVSSRIDRDTLCERSGYKWCCDRQPNNCFIPLQVSVTPQQYFQVIGVRVFIWDVNDHSPSWPKRIYRVEMPEDADVGDTIGVPAPSDSDSGYNTTQRYRLDDSSRTFTLDKSGLGIRPEPGVNGEVRLRLNRQLDRETMALYNLTLYAMDGGHAPRTGSVSIQVRVTDVNDHAPHFSKSLYEEMVSESAQIHHFILKVSAKDEDEGNNARITYSFPNTVSRQVLRHFKLDPTSGEITLLTPLDYEARREFDFTVMARDGNENPRSTSARVRILVKDENDCEPRLRIDPVQSDRPLGNSLISQGTSRLSVPENEPPGYVAAILKAEDCDSGEAGNINCNLKDGDQFRLERLDTGSSSSQSYKLVSLVRFDRERTDSVDLTIECADGGTPRRETRRSVKVEILDKNDERPIFRKSHYVFNVSENMPQNTIVGTVRAVDADIKANGLFFYKILPVRDARRFKINRVTGQISTLTRLDRESQSLLRLQVAAIDSGAPSLSSTTNVNIHVNDVNDCTPKFEHSTYQFVLRENSPGGLEVGRLVATDDDAQLNSALKFIIQPQPSITRSSFLPFHIDALRQDNAYVAVLRTTQEIDRETPVFEHDATCTFQVIVRDSGHPTLSSQATVSVTIQDVNDKSPKWIFPNTKHFTVNVSYTEDTGSLVVMVQAKDRDAGPHAEVHYYINKGNEKQLFVLDPQSGALQIRRAITPKDIRTHTLVLHARDNPGFPNNSHTSVAILKVNIYKGVSGLNEVYHGVYDDSSGHRPSRSDRNITIIATIVGCTFAVALVLVLIIMLAKIFIHRRHMTMMKRGSNQPGGPDCRQEGSYPKPELVYYTTECVTHQSTMGSPKSLGTLSSGSRMKKMPCDDQDSLSIAMLGDEEKKYVPQPKRLQQPPAYTEAVNGGGGGGGPPEDRRDYTPLGCTTLDHAYYDVVHGMGPAGDKEEEAFAMVPPSAADPGHKMMEVKYTNRARPGVFEASFV